MSTENKLNWKKDLDKFNLLNAKILYMINYFFNINHFDNEQKKKLKELVILENSDIINSFKKFEKNSNLNDLEKNFQNIYDNEIGVNIKKDGKDGLKSIIHIRIVGYCIGSRSFFPAVKNNIGRSSGYASVVIGCVAVVAVVCSKISRRTA